MIKVINRKLPNKKEGIIIVPFFDVHLGDPNCCEGLLVDSINYVKEHNNAYAVLGGDICDCAIPNSIGNSFEQTMTPQEALALACNYFKPIKDKILCVCDGNHEDRITKLTSISVMAQFCVHLGIEDAYCPEGAFLNLRLQFENKGARASHYIYVTHGSGGGKRIGGKLNALSELGNIIPRTNVVIAGHTHLPATFKEDYLDYDPQSGTLKQCERLYVNSNAYMLYGGYGAKKGYRPANRSVPKVYLTAYRSHNGIIAKRYSCEV